MDWTLPNLRLMLSISIHKITRNWFFYHSPSLPKHSPSIPSFPHSITLLPCNTPRYSQALSVSASPLPTHSLAPTVFKRPRPPWALGALRREQISLATVSQIFVPCFAPFPLHTYQLFPFFFKPIPGNFCVEGQIFLLCTEQFFLIVGTLRIPSFLSVFPHFLLLSFDFFVFSSSFSTVFLSGDEWRWCRWGELFFFDNGYHW